MKFKIGKTMIRIQATDLAGNVQKCQFTIRVLGEYVFNFQKNMYIYIRIVGRTRLMRVVQILDTSDL